MVSERVISFRPMPIISDAFSFHEGDSRMVVRKRSGKGASPRRMGKSRRTAKGSATWEEHNERVKYAVALGTERFLREHKDKIEVSSGESVARNSYLSGMIDMLSIARGTFGFWGADQILDELERINRRSGRVEPRLHPGSGVTEGDEGDAPGVVGAPQTGLPTVEGGAAKASKGTKRDPMFA